LNSARNQKEHRNISLPCFNSFNRDDDNRCPGFIEYIG